MSISSGTRFGPYEIVAPLGAGGMGEVYRARDTRLERTVAVKILPSHLSSDPIRKQRFEREAKTISSLNHPHICTLYDVGQQDGVDFLVMECVEGETLSKRLEKGPLPVEQVLKFGAQIADALDKAHRAGIVHRDLKPGNIMLTPTGAKLLDFGLAKPAAAAVSGMTLTGAATHTTPVTQEGMVVGTFQYMSPEQIEGKELDGRSDIFSFGAVLYEMLTGQRAFGGKSQLSVASAILEKEPPPISSVKPMTPPALDHAIRRSLAKDPEERWQTARDLGLELLWVGKSGLQAEARAITGGRGRSVIWAGVGVLLGAALIVGAAVLFRGKPSAAPVIRFSVALPQGQSVWVQSPPQFAISPDGARLAFRTLNAAGKYELHWRSLDSEELKALPVAGGEGDAGNPFFSPDGEWLGLFSSVSNKLEKVALSGGGPQSLCDVTYATATWPEKESIVLAVGGQGLFRVPSAGGTLQTIGVAGATDQYLRSAPEVLPGGKAILSTVHKDLRSQQDIVAFDLSTQKAQMVIHQGVNPHYLDPGYLVFGRGGSIWAAPFDAAHLKVTGEPAPIVEGVLVEQPGRGVEQFTLSKSGTLAYLAGTFTEAQRQVVVVDVKGVSKMLTPDAKAFEDLALSPDGSKAAMTIEGATWSIWIYDFAGKTLRRLTFENDNRDPLWTRDGKRVVYSSLRGGVDGLYWRPADGSGSEEELLSDKSEMYAASWTPDGKSLAYGLFSLATNEEETWILPVVGDRKPYPFLQSAFDQGFAAFSPDEHWIAYDSSETGRAEVYVKPFPGPGGKWQVSTEGGERPEWSKDGKELFYRAGNQLMAVRVGGKDTFSAGRPEPLFGGTYLHTGHYYDVMPDGKHFVFIQTAQANDRPTKINVVVNWLEELKRRVPLGKNQ